MLELKFDDDLNRENTISEEEVEKHGIVIQKYEENQPHDVYISPKRLASIQSEYDCVVVNDFGDDYHLSEEERTKKNKFYEAFKTLRRAKKKYRRIDEFVVVCREALKCLEIVATENNTLYTPEKFMKKYFRGEIEISGLEFPKYVGKDRKDIDWVFISEFIVSDRDPKELVIKNDREIVTKDELEEFKKRAYSEEEKARLAAPIPEKIAKLYDSVYIDMDKVAEDDELAMRFARVENSQKQQKKLVKAFPVLKQVFREKEAEARSRDRLGRIASYDEYDMNEEELRRIAKYDAMHGYVDDVDSMPKLQGSMLNDKDYNKYMHDLEEWELDHCKDNYNGRMLTLREIRDHEVKDLLSEAGWNIRALWNNKEKEKKLIKDRKKFQKREKELKKELVYIEERTGNKSDKINELRNKIKKGKNKKKSKKKNKEYE